MNSRTRKSSSGKILGIAIPVAVVALTICGFLFRDKLTAAWHRKFGGAVPEEQPPSQPVLPEWDVDSPNGTRKADRQLSENTGRADLGMPLEEESPADDGQKPLTLSDAERGLAERAGNISDSPLWKQLLGMERPLLMFVRMLDDVSHGERPLVSLGFMRSGTQFQASSKGGRLVISPETSARYAPFVKMTEAVNVDKAARLYLHLEPVLQEAYEELGYTEGHVRDLLAGAIRQILETPILSEDAPLVARGTPGLYSWADDSLESLTPVQKLFLRLGRENGATVRRQLEAFGDAVGLWE